METTAGLDVRVSFRGAVTTISFEDAERASVLDLKREVAGRLRIAPERQRLMGLRASRDGDAALIRDVYKPGARLMLIGTPDAELEAAARLESAAAAARGGDADAEDDGRGERAAGGAPSSSVPAERRPENLERLRRRALKMREVIELRGAPRRNSRLLVLDIDYTLFDHKSTAENILELQRPFLHEFLEACWAHNYGTRRADATGAPPPRSSRLD